MSTNEENIKLLVSVAKGMGITDEGQIAYILATVEHESKFQPIEEANYMGKARQMSYLKKKSYYPYYGRGFVQITHDYNYKKFGELTNKPLLQQPELALDICTSAFCTVYGMKEGLYNPKGKPMSFYIQGAKREFVAARYLVNLQDKAQYIAGLAEKWLKQAKDLLAGAEPIILNGSAGTQSNASNKPLPGDYSTSASALGGVTGIISAVFKSSCTEPFPQSFNLIEAIRYVGCKSKLASAQMGSTGLGYPAAAMQVQGQSATGLGGQAAGAPVCPGCLIWPFVDGVQSGKSKGKWVISAPYAQPRSYGPHHGVDIAGAGILGVELISPADGEVVENKFEGPKKGYGHYLTIDHKNGLFTRYGHLQESGLAVGTQVKQGTVIGHCGNTGHSTGPHLHFEVRKNADYSFASTSNPVEYCK